MAVKQMLGLHILETWLEQILAHAPLHRILPFVSAAFTLTLSMTESVALMPFFHRHVPAGALTAWTRAWTGSKVGGRLATYSAFHTALWGVLNYRALRHLPFFTLPSGVLVTPTITSSNSALGNLLTNVTSTLTRLFSGESAIWYLRPTLKTWYGAGTLVALCRLLYYPTILHAKYQIRQGGPKEPKSMLRVWLKYQWLMYLTCDLPAMLLFAKAAYTTTTLRIQHV